MRMITILGTAAAMSLATAAGAQDAAPTPQAAPTPPAQAAPAPASPEAPAAPSAQPQIQSINVVDFSQLPAETQKKVDDIAAQRSGEDLQKLRGAIDATPEIKSALEAKGLTSEDVVVASLSQNGALTLVTKKKAG